MVAPLVTALSRARRSVESSGFGINECENGIVHNTFMHLSLKYAYKGCITRAQSLFIPYILMFTEAN